MQFSNWLRSQNARTSQSAHTNPKRKRGPFALEPLEPRALLATFQGLGDASPGEPFESEARAISGDGLTVVGSGFRWTSADGMRAIPISVQDVSYDGSVIVGGTDQAVFWTEATGVVGLGELPGGSIPGRAWAVSDNGSVVAGYDSSTQHPSQEGFRWTAGTGMVGLGSLPGETQGSIMQGISGDGQVIVGRGNEGGGCCGGSAVKWTEGGGMVSLGRLPGRTNSRASGASGDGSVIVGWSGEAFRWTETGGMEGLGILPGMNFSWAFDVTADGSVIVGRSYMDEASNTPSRAFIWDGTHGMRDLQNVLASDYGLGAALAGWELSYGADTPDISADGMTISGTGTNPLGFREAWIATLTPPDPGAPTVDAGPNQTILAGQAASLDGTVTDNNGAPAPTVQWSVVSGPGTVTFGDDTAEDTTATFSTTGTYGLKLEATDGALTGSDVVYVTVNPLTADLTAVADTYIAGKNASTNFGGTGTLIADGNPDNGALLRWNLGAIPAGSTVQSATLSFNVTGTSGDTYEIYELKRSWNESQATWNKATTSPSVNWQVAGAQGANDRGTTVLGSISAPAAGVRTITLNAAGLAVVQGWVNNPSSNNGLVLQDYSNSTNDDLVISSRESAVAANRPRLIITYAPPGAPSSVVVTVANESRPTRESRRLDAQRQPRAAATSSATPVPSGQAATLDPATVDATMRLYATRRPRATRIAATDGPA